MLMDKCLAFVIPCVCSADASLSTLTYILTVKIVSKYCNIHYSIQFEMISSKNQPFELNSIKTKLEHNSWC